MVDPRIDFMKLYILFGTHTQTHEMVELGLEGTLSY